MCAEPIPGLLISVQAAPQSASCNGVTGHLVCQLVAQYLLVYVVWFIQLQVLCIIFSLLKFIAMCKTFDCFCKELDVERKNSPRSSY